MPTPARGASMPKPPPASGFAGGIPRPSRSWTASTKPEIHINNVHAQDTNGPINVETEPDVEKIVINTGTAEEEIQTPFDEPQADVSDLEEYYDPLFGMLFAVVLVASPLVWDYLQDWPVPEYTEAEYLEPIWQWIIAGVSLVVAMAVLDKHYGLRARYRPRVLAVQNGIQNMITPAAESTVEMSQGIYWGLEDLVLGEGQQLLGMLLAAGLVVLVSMREPLKDSPETEYADAPIQFVYLAGAGVIGMLIGNT